MEKYVPIRTQGAISDTLSKVLGEEAKIKLFEYEKAKNQQLYKVIIDDDGNPNLMDELRLIRMKLEDKL